jgi:hypothetical protein
VIFGKVTIHKLAKAAKMPLVKGDLTKSTRRIQQHHEKASESRLPLRDKRKKHAVTRHKNYSLNPLKCSGVVRRKKLHLDVEQPLQHSHSIVFLTVTY